MKKYFDKGMAGYMIGEILPFPTNHEDGALSAGDGGFYFARSSVPVTLRRRGDSL